MKKLLFLVLLASPAFGQPAPVGSGCANYNQGPLLTIACALPVAAGNQLVIGTGNFNWPLSSVADNSVAVCGAASSNSYTDVANANYSNWSVSALYVSSIKCSGTITVTATFANQSGNPGPSISVQQYSGVSATLDGSAVVSNATPVGSVYTGSPITTLNASDAIFSIFSVLNSGSTWSLTSSGGFTSRVGGASGYLAQTMVSDNIVSSTGIYTPVVTVSAGSTNANAFITFAVKASVQNTVRHRLIIGE